MPFPDQISKLFAEALEISSSADRQEFVKQHCAGDAELEADLMQMLRVHEHATGFLSQPPGASHSASGQIGRESVIGRLAERFDLPVAETLETNLPEPSMKAKVAPTSMARASMTERASAACGAETAGTPGLRMPAFSAAISPRVSPRRASAR